MIMIFYVVVGAVERLGETKDEPVVVVVSRR